MDQRAGPVRGRGARVTDAPRDRDERAPEKGGLFLKTMHPHALGYRSRIFIRRELPARIAAKGACRIATHAHIARPCAAEAGPKGQR